MPSKREAVFAAVGVLVGVVAVVVAASLSGASLPMAPGSPPYLFDKSDKAWELLDGVAQELGATVESSGGSGGGHSLNRSRGRGRFTSQSAAVKLNGADHYQLIARFVGALESDIEASGFALASSSRPADPASKSLTYDFHRSYTGPAGKVSIGEVRVWSTRMPNDRVRITLVGLDYP